MTMQPSTWNEAALYRAGFHATRTFFCDQCSEEVTVYENVRRESSKLYLTSDMEVHPYHEIEDRD